MKQMIIDNQKRIFYLYIFLMLILLFARIPSTEDYSYYELIHMNLNLIPFKTISNYYFVLKYPFNSYIAYVAFINLVGNLVVFIPLGLFLPIFFRTCRKYIFTLFVSTISVSVIEILQLVTLRGSLDIDDLILNVI